MFPDRDLVDSGTDNFHRSVAGCTGTISQSSIPILPIPQSEPSFIRTYEYLYPGAAEVTLLSRIRIGVSVHHPSAVLPRVPENFVPIPHSSPFSKTSREWSFPTVISPLDKVLVLFLCCRHSINLEVGYI